jgi:hypothetical protein
VLVCLPIFGWELFKSHFWNVPILGLSFTNVGNFFNHIFGMYQFWDYHLPMLGTFLITFLECTNFGIISYQFWELF